MKDQHEYGQPLCLFIAVTLSMIGINLSLTRSTPHFNLPVWDDHLLQF